MMASKNMDLKIRSKCMYVVPQSRKFGVVKLSGTTPEILQSSAHLATLIFGILHRSRSLKREQPATATSIAFHSIPRSSSTIIALDIVDVSSASLHP